MNARVIAVGEAAAARRVATRVAQVADAGRALPGVQVTVIDDTVEIAARGLTQRRWDEPALRWLGTAR